MGFIQVVLSNMLTVKHWHVFNRFLSTFYGHDVCLITIIYNSNMQLLSSIRVFSRRKIKHKFNDLVNRSTKRIMQQKSTNVVEDNCKIKPNFLKDVVETVSWDINIGTQNGLQNLKRHAYFSGQNTWKTKNNSPYRFWVTTCTYNL